MIDARVSLAIRVAIRFGKWVASLVPLVVVLIEKEIEFKHDPSELEKGASRLCRGLVRKYMLFYKLRRRAWKIAMETYPDLAESRDVRKNVALKRLIARLEEVAGLLDEVMQKSCQKFAIDDDLPRYAASLWRGRSNPPPLIELEVLRWGQHELEEDVLLEMDSWERLLKGENVAPGPLTRRDRKKCD